MTVGLGFSDIPLGVRLGGNRSKAHIAMDIRLIDSSTGRVLQSHRVEAEAKSTGLAIGLDYRQGSIGTDQFAKTPFGEAARKAVAEAVDQVISGLNQVSWAAQVIDSQDGSIFVNAGTDSGVEVGDTFTASAIAKELIDPSTGIRLDRIEQKLGRVRIDHVAERYSVATALGNFEVKRGDLLRD